MIDINLLVFLAMVMSGLGFLDFELDDLIAWGASSGSLDHGFGLVRLVTATFVHAGLFHILGNMYGLLIGGAFLSPVARNTRLLFTYLVSGIGGSLLSKAVHPDIVSVGASGAIFGLFGALIALVVLRDAKISRSANPSSGTSGFSWCSISSTASSTPGVGNFVPHQRLPHRPAVRRRDLHFRSPGGTTHRGNARSQFANAVKQRSKDSLWKRRRKCCVDAAQCTEAGRDIRPVPRRNEEQRARTAARTVNSRPVFLSISTRPG